MQRIFGGHKGSLHVRGNGEWTLTGATLNDVTHHSANAARYTSAGTENYRVLVVDSHQVAAPAWKQAVKAWAAHKHVPLQFH